MSDRLVSRDLTKSVSWIWVHLSWHAFHTYMDNRTRRNLIAKWRGWVKVHGLWKFLNAKYAGRCCRVRKSLAFTCKSWRQLPSGLWEESRCHWLQQASATRRVWHFGFENSRFRNFSNFLEGIGFGIEKIWSRKKYRIMRGEPVSLIAASICNSRPS